MKLDRLYKDIKKEYNRTTIKKKFNNKKEIEPIIIGITGSRGKSTVAYLLHNYLKKIGFKSILYSSLGFDSPGTFNVADEPYEKVLGDNEVIFHLINESKNYNPDFIVLEVHEYALENKNVRNIPFDVRVLTNLNPLHNEEMYEKDEYVGLKMSFFENVDNNCKCVIGFQDYDKELLDKMLSLNKCQKLIYSSQYVAELKGIQNYDILSLLTDLTCSLDGMDFEIKLNNEYCRFKTSLIMPYNSLNILSVITILKSLNLFDYKTFENYIKDVKIPGRCALTKVKNRYIIVDYFLNPLLENLKKYQKQGLVNQIRVVTGSIGTGYSTWDEKFKSEKFVNSRNKSRRFAMDILNEFADVIYLTENDNAKEDVNDICNELASYLNTNKVVKIYPQREEAIEKALIESNEKDVIVISGRGERRILCNQENKTRLVKDKDVIEKVLNDMEWYYYGSK